MGSDQPEALDRTRLLSDVTRMLSDQHVYMGETKHLGHVPKAVRHIEGVYDCYRVMSNSS